jgi:DNA polymerase-3 subunit alpha
VRGLRRAAQPARQGRIDHRSRQPSDPARGTEGYQNLIKLTSAGYTEGFYYRPRIDKELLAQHARGLIGLSSCLKGEIPSELRTDQERRALDAAATYRDIFGPGNFFLELQDQGIPDQAAVNGGLVRVARALDLPLVCTNDVHYLHERRTARHPICIGTGKTVNDPERLRYPAGVPNRPRDGLGVRTPTRWGARSQSRALA